MRRLGIFIMGLTGFLIPIVFIQTGTDQLWHWILGYLSLPLAMFNIKALTKLTEK